MKVSPLDDLHYSVWPGIHYLIEDDGNIVGYFLATKEIPLSKQQYTKISDICWYNSNDI